ncbi:MAG: type II secretion system F family protein [Planctomycetota bacterium]
MDLRLDQIALFRKFAHLYDSGVPLAEALALAGGELGETIRAAVAQMENDVYRGSSLADSMGRLDAIFAPEIVGVIRAGEQRGELGGAARAAASGLEGRILDPAVVAPADLDALLERAAAGAVVHVGPDATLRIRGTGHLGDAEEADAVGLTSALSRRIGVETGTGAFVWKDRLVRVSLALTHRGTAGVVRIGSPPTGEPREAAAWRHGPPSVLAVAASRQHDLDAALRGILAAFDPERMSRVAVDLPVPEALSVSSLEAALSLDPDVVCMARLRRPADAARLVDAADAGIHALAGVASPRPFGDLPHTLLRLGDRD